MKRLCLVFLVALACGVSAAVPKGGPQYQTDSGTVGFLRRYLISGGEIQYPLEAARAKQAGSLLFVMKLRPDGTVESLKLQSSTGDAVFAKPVEQTLKGYRFKPKTPAPLVWLVSFLPPATVLVKVYRYDEKNPPFLPK